MDTSLLNPWAILVAALSNFVVGGLWYSPALMGRAWMRANQFTEQDLEQGSPARIFGIAFLFCVLMATTLAVLLAVPETTVLSGFRAGLLAGSGLAGLGLGVVALFERRPWSYVLVNGGYLTLSFALMGTVLGAWR